MKKVTKRILEQAEKICKENGYWSKEINEFISKFETYLARQKIHNHLSKFR